MKKMNITNSMWLILLLSIASFNLLASEGHVASEDYVASSKVDFIHYKAELAPSFRDKSVIGKVNIEFAANVEDVKQLSFSAKYKTIHSVKFNGAAVASKIENERLLISFKQPLQVNENYYLTIAYQASPKRGMKFYDDHLFTVYHTKNWLVSHDSIADKASFELLLTHDANLVSIGNGRLVSSRQQAGNYVISHWLQESPVPIYTFGFALGEFDMLSTTYNNSPIFYFYRKSEQSGLNRQKMEEVFVDVPDMIEFFEAKAGFALPNKFYHYVVVEGYMAQEAAGFSLVGEKYAHTVLEDKNENWFIAHEIAHEWWGNSITCANFSHFWLNEGLVQFLVAAYKQHRFGDAAYKQEIGVAVARVERAVKKGKVSPVAFKHQIKEENINRTMTYSKGAIVFHMLREQLGEEVFWRALKNYSMKYKQSSVTTNDLKRAFEEASKQDLSSFFDRWVYGQDIPKLNL